MDDSNVGLDVRARLDVDMRIYVEDVRFDVRATGLAAAAAVDMAAAAAGLASHLVTNRIAHVESIRLTGSSSGMTCFCIISSIKCLNSIHSSVAFD